MKRTIPRPKRIRRAPRKGARAPQPAARPELNAASRALLGPDRELRPYRPRSEDASVEDPLEDWPED
jgi:hypothetical protein